MRIPTFLYSQKDRIEYFYKEEQENGWTKENTKHCQCGWK